jgi:hypothetical protein
MKGSPPFNGHLKLNFCAKRTPILDGFCRKSDKVGGDQANVGSLGSLDSV